MSVRTTLFTIIVVAIALLAGCDRGATDTQDPMSGKHRVTHRDLFNNHTNPPIILGGGSILWYMATTEEPIDCLNDADCHGDICYASTASATPSWCMRRLATHSPIFDKDGKCIADPYPYLDPRVIGEAVHWASNSTKGDVKDKKYKIKSAAYDLEIKFGKKDKKTTIRIKHNTSGKWCGVTSTTPKYGTIPVEFALLTDIENPAGASESPPLGWASCEETPCLP